MFNCWLSLSQQLAYTLICIRKLGIVSLLSPKVSQQLACQDYALHKEKRVKKDLQAKLAKWQSGEGKRRKNLSTSPVHHLSSCFTSFFFPFSSTMEPGHRRWKDDDDKYWNGTLPLVVYHVQFEGQ